MTAREIDKALDNWLVLNKVLRTIDIDDCKEMLSTEQAGKRRLNYMLRIYGRYNRLRSDRERREL
jgi:hypothetical protein